MSRNTDSLIKYTVLACCLGLGIVGLLLLMDCSSEYMRERETPGMRNGVVTDLHKYCLEYPKDSACQKDK